MIKAMANDRRYRKALSRTLKSLRGTRTQKEVAEAASIPTSTWCKIEQGRQLPRDTTFARIAVALDCAVADLERIISENVLEEIEQGSGAESAPRSARGKNAAAFDLAGVPENAAQRIETTLGTIKALRKQLDTLELDVISLGREFQMLTGAA